MADALPRIIDDRALLRLDEAHMPGIRKNIVDGRARAAADLPNIVEDLAKIAAGLAQIAAKGAHIPENRAAHPA